MVAVTADNAPAQLVEMSNDVRTAVLIDAAGNALSSSEPQMERARKMAELVRELIEAADAASELPTEQLEAHVDGGAVYAMRSPRHTLACVTRKVALSSLVLYDLRETLAELERPHVRRDVEQQSQDARQDASRSNQ